MKKTKYFDVKKKLQCNQDRNSKYYDRNSKEEEKFVKNHKVLVRDNKIWIPAVIGDSHEKYNCPNVFFS
jgi:hypothetical protein